MTDPALDAIAKAHAAGMPYRERAVMGYAMENGQAVKMIPGQHQILFSLSLNRLIQISHRLFPACLQGQLSRPELMVHLGLETCQSSIHQFLLFSSQRQARASQFLAHVLNPCLMFLMGPFFQHSKQVRFQGLDICGGSGVNDFRFRRLTKTDGKASTLGLTLEVCHG